MINKRKTKLIASLQKVTVALLSTVILLCSMVGVCYAQEQKIAVEGNVYEFEKDSHYEFSENTSPKSTKKADTYGTFSINGNIAEVSEKNGVPCYRVEDGNLKLYYNHSNALLRAAEDEWHLVDDKSKEIDEINLDEDIMKGALIVQTSKDGKSWVDAVSITDAFNATPIRTAAIYTTEDVELINGCYYRIIVAYKASKKIEPKKILFIDINQYED